MSDSQFYKSSYGSVRLWISRLSTDKTRTLVVHEPTTGDDHIVQDRGRVPLRARATLLFDWMSGDTQTPLERFNEFRALVDEESHVFTHPAEGSFQARVGSFTYEIDASGVITAEVEFVAVTAVTDIISAGAGSIPPSGDGAVDAAALKYDEEFRELGIDDVGLGTAAREAVDSWSASDVVDPRSVYVDTGMLTSRLGEQASAYEDDLEAWPMYVATLLLSDAVRVAAASATADTASTFSVKIASAVALRALLAAEYGADEVPLRYDQIMLLNDISDPLLLTVGSEYQFPSHPPRARNG